MQLTKKLSLAVCTLLSANQAQASDILYDLSVLNYSEKDNQQQDRVSVFEPVLSVTQQNSEFDYIKFDIVLDSLTGASPNGANASSQAQNFKNNSTKAGVTPLDPRFNDDRVAIDISWMKPLSRLSRYIGGLSLSNESDYRSAGFNYTHFQDINNKLTTLSIGGAYSYDAFNPNGGLHDGFTSIYATTPTPTVTHTVTSASGGRGGGENISLFPGEIKQSFDGILGISHILNAYTLLNLNYGLSYVDGYQTDPYKYVSVINNLGFPVDYVYEKRPDTRLKQTIKGSLVTAIGDDSLHLEYRNYSDSWGVRANTYDVKYYFELGNKLTIRPHYRYSKQDKADFFKISLNQGAPNPQYVSADYRLSDMETVTTGGMIEYHMNDDMTLSLNVEKMIQTGNSYPAEAIGDQRLNDMFPDLEFWAITVGIKGRW